ncbi:G-type lectin S-receptor-like serine/threonine-protein kinase SD2-5 [Camellia sinensis]|uniref:G-type lectin S-receptor-like serine/threonine-protein kinase SD2-5 n=1 Tax=Camellia sinensis TaxID=4442 RepID=UPI0010368AF2|nr:G-type lectin S-receptor-like serine/threonine-protein kinase SD2-5 [Camellia sinensis]
MIILGSSLGALFGVFFVVAFCFFLFRNKGESEELDKFYIDQLPGMPTGFSYEELKVMTTNFDNKLGEGGFGSVFQGTLSDGTNVAVKRLNGFGQVKKSFLTEVETIGSTHHVNLVRLIRFCAEKSYRLLVYEYMSDGSLDTWIFQRHQDLTLGWQSRKKIIMDIAKGLTYLHEECRQKIFHLDIKPQNILLDECFNVKISDFGLSKLIDKDQSQVVTMMRGTPGYLAPEWLSSIITKKVDVYSFGVVVLEMLCG